MPGALKRITDEFGGDTLNFNYYPEDGMGCFITLAAPLVLGELDVPYITGVPPKYFIPLNRPFLVPHFFLTKDFLCNIQCSKRVPVPAGRRSGY